MKAYRFRLITLSPWATPWHADTLFGSLCWAWREIAGEANLEAMLSGFDGLEPGKEPPFVLSDGLPGDLLPFPIGAQNDIPEGSKIKPQWCRTDGFTAWANGSANLLVAPRKQADEPQRVFSSFSVLHAQRNRITDCTDGGELFEVYQQSFQPDAITENHFSVYVRADWPTVRRLAACWEALSWRGFGRKATSGLGAFRLEGEPEPCDWLGILPAHNGFVSLSHFVPAQNDPRHGYWKVHVSNPKFASDRVIRFLKGNLVTLTPGSRFLTEEQPAPFYGRMLPMPRDEYPRAVHYGLAFPAPMRWPDE